VLPDRGAASVAQLAAPAQLLMPREQLALEGLQPISAFGSGTDPPLPRRALPSATAASRAALGTSVVGVAEINDPPLFSYNSSEMAPLVPLYLAWMTDIRQMLNRTAGLDFEAARVLSTYVAIAYCSPKRVADWSCARCGDLSPGFRVQAVVNDAVWDLMAYVGYSSQLGAAVVAFRGTDSHSLYNW
jgi:hypothetical protein